MKCSLLKDKSEVGMIGEWPFKIFANECNKYYNYIQNNNYIYIYIYVVNIIHTR